MRRSLLPWLEPLEARALLVGFRYPPPVVPSPPAPAVVSVVLTTDHAVYSVGQPVTMTLTETDITNHPVFVPVGPSIDGFIVKRLGALDWRSNAGPQPQIVTLKSLLPGESFTLSAVWNGETLKNPPTRPTGTFTVSSQVNGASPVAFTIVPAPVSASPIAAVVSTSQVTYPVGQPVPIVITETNVSGQPQSVSSGGPDSVAITRRGVEVWRVPQPAGSSQPAEVLAPGQSRTLSVVWPGQFTEHLRQPRTGLFVVSVRLDGASGTTQFQVARS